MTPLKFRGHGSVQYDVYVTAEYIVSFNAVYGGYDTFTVLFLSNGSRVEVLNTPEEVSRMLSDAKEKVNG